jgi:hypothetical protein
MIIGWDVKKCQKTLAIVDENGILLCGQGGERAVAAFRG